jgi:signal transduction histidine kinase
MTFPLAVLAFAALAAFGAMGAVAGALWMKTRAAAALRRATEDRTRLLSLADHWVWETDAGHRLTTWRAPSQRPAGWRTAPTIGSLLADIARPVAQPSVSAAPAGSQSADATPLARQMAAHAPIPLQRVVLRIGTSTPTWALRGEPRHDGAGHFLGYFGSARPVGESEAAEFARAALAQLLPHLDAAVLLFRRTDEASPWRLAAHGAGAQPLMAIVDESHANDLDGDGDAADSLDWQTACGRLPADVAQALAQMPAGETRTIGDWRVSWALVGAHDDAQAGRLVVLRKAVATETAAQSAPLAPVSADASTSAVDVADHESFIYSVSHDLRAPIRVVEGFARILKEDYGRFLDRIGNDHTDRILAAAARMNSMIDALLALSRLQSQPLKRQPVDLSQLTRYVLEDLRSSEPEREAEIHIEPGLVVQGDPTLMRIAIENLVGNAWKYSSQSPRTRIELRREVLAGQPTYVVADAGAGFDMRFADRLFGVFQRLHSAKDFQGTGVGLASVRRIIRRHGGEIWAESEVGKGARFYFTIP